MQMASLLRNVPALRCGVGLAAAALWPCAAHGQHPDSIAFESRLPAVEITENRRPAVVRSAVPLQVMDSRAIERLGVQDLSGAVRRFSGVTVKDYGGIGGLKTVSIRGLGAQHTAVGYDGITVGNCQSGEIDLSKFSLDNVESLSLSIGQSDRIFQNARMFASAGALEIETKKPDFSRRPYSGRVQVRTGSFGLFNPSFRYDRRLSRRVGASLGAEWTSAKGEYPFTLVNREQMTKEKRKNSDVQSLRLESDLYADWGKQGRLKGKLYFFDSERGLPGSVVLYNPYAKQRLWDKIFFGQLHYEKPFGRQLTLRLQAKYNYAYNRFIDPAYRYDGSIQDDRYTQQEYYGSAGLLYAPSEAWSFTIAEDVFHNRLKNNFADCPYPERITSLSVAAARYQTSRLTVVASLLGTYTAEKVTKGDAAPHRKKLSPAASLSYRPWEGSNFRIRASYKNIFRVPTFNDLYYARIGNRSLRPESTGQFNLGLAWSGSAGKAANYLSVSVDAYYNRVKDKIVAIPTLFLWKMMNMGKVRAAGTDVNLASEFALPAGLSLTLTAAYSYARAVDITDPEAKNYKDQIPYAPRHAGSGSVGLETPWVNATYSLIASGLRYALPQNIDDNRVERYTEHSLSLSRLFRLGQAQLRLQADAVNLGNKNYDIIQFYPMPGRSFRATIGYIF